MVTTLNAQRYLALVRGERRGWWPGMLRLGLRCLSVPYGIGARMRNRLFDWGWKQRYRAAVPVISVGNLTLGGTGKTPCVEAVARFFRHNDFRVAILSRGYGSDDGRNDEAQVLEQNLPDVPHLQGTDRVALAKIAVEELESELLILDDGFQHRRLYRDLDIVLVDSTNPWGHGYLFPRGLLREPRSSLHRANIIVLTRCDQVAAEEIEALKRTISRHAPHAAAFRATHEPVQWINANGETKAKTFLADRPVAAFSGVGNPDAFRQTIGSVARTVVDWRVYADHHNYSRDDVESLRAWGKTLPPDCALATTQKDLVKIRTDTLGGRELWALQIQMQFVEKQNEWEAELAKVMPGGG